MSKPQSYASVWDAIADTPEEAANLRARAEQAQLRGLQVSNVCEHGKNKYLCRVCKPVQYASRVNRKRKSPGA